MKSPNITSGRAVKTAAGWIHGVNSVRNPWALPEDQIKWAVNCSIRGGVVQTRPGFSMRLSLPPGNFQGGILFAGNKQARASSTYKTQAGVLVSEKAAIYTVDGTESLESEIPYIVFAVSGKVYYCPFPLTQPRSWTDYQLTNISLDPNVERVNFVTATQSAKVSTGSDLTITPSHRIVVVQDGVRAACSWDGSNKTGEQNIDVPIGFWMAYSGNRLWVATGNVISASDLGNPLGWTERVSGTGRGDFSVARPITAMQDYVGQNNDSRLYVFTDRSTYSLASGILNRSLWAETPNFQNVLFPTIGCVAGKSICFQAGMMWWYSQGGLVSADVAASSYLSSQVLYKDVEMAKAKRLMSENIGNICCAAFENYLLVSIPYLEAANSATMVLDYAAASEWNQARNPAWAGVWTGIRPVEWVSGVVSGQPRCFAFSVDYAPTNDGSYLHLWEAFTQNRYDTYLATDTDGTVTEFINRIYCQMETGLLGDGMDLKQLIYAEVDASQIAGTVDVKVSYRGTKGTYQQILNTRVLAATDEYQYQTSGSATEIEDLGFLQTQHRRFITESVQADPFQKSCESNYLTNIDKCFSLLVEWCGGFGVDSVRMFQDPFSDKSTGTVTIQETQYCALGEDGNTILVSLQPPPKEEAFIEQGVWFATKTASYAFPDCDGGQSSTATATASAKSYISQADANVLAQTKAENEAYLASVRYRAANPCT
jgi:hypothetical protein